MSMFPEWSPFRATISKPREVLALPIGHFVVCTPDFAAEVVSLAASQPDFFGRLSVAQMDDGNVMLNTGRVP